MNLHWKWFLGLAGLLAALLLAVNLGLNLTLPDHLVQRIRADLERNALVARAAYPGTNANEFAHDLAGQTRLRITIIARDGTVLGESDKPPEQLGQIENHLYRPEIQAALRSGTGSAIRHSETVGADMMYVAVADGERGFVRVALPLFEIQHTISQVRRTVAFASVVVIVLALPVVFWLSRRLTVPLEGMRAMAKRVAAGDFSQRAPERGGAELAELGAALNEMSRQLEIRLRELANEKAELAGILASMTEGVLVVDSAGKIALANDTLRRQFQLTDAVTGRTVLEAFRNVALAELIAATGSRELTLLDDRVFAVTAAALRDRAGAVVVFHDITRLKQLENIRKEFVANVSHELRTPLSIIKGYVETLLDEQPAQPFLETIQKHARRLEMLIDDLLSISELESQQARLNLAPVSLRHCLDEELLARGAGRITIELPDTPVRADAERLRQVFNNLLDNALKYTRGPIRVSGRVRDNELEVCVADEGPGIAPEHLPRIFERFYRVDKARSRELGGTGLGLAIVKHIVQAHGGRVWAESELEKGSRFFFTLPKA